jgi:hypothetical protein
MEEPELLVEDIGTFFCALRADKHLRTKSRCLRGLGEPFFMWRSMHRERPQRRVPSDAERPCGMPEFSNHEAS